MRVFIGVKASKQLQKKVRGWRKIHAGLPVRWIKEHNLHLTLVPPWYEDDIEKAKKKLHELPFSRHTVTFDRVGINFKNKVIWIGKPTEHVTIARFRDAEPLKGIQFGKICWKETADTVTLFESRLGPKEANYYEIAKKVVR